MLLLYRAGLRARLKIGAVVAVAAALVAAPLALFFLMNPVAFATKIEQVAEPNADKCARGSVSD